MKKLLSFFLAMVCVTASAFAGEFTVAFKSTTGADGSSAFTTSKDVSTLVTEGAEYLASIKATNNVYQGKSGYGLKFSSGTKNGVLELNLSDSYKITKVVATACRYNNNDAGKLSVNGAEAQDLTAELAEYTFDFDGTEVSTLKLSATKRIYVTKLVVTYADGDAPVVLAPVVKMGAQNYVEITAEEGAEVYYSLDGTDPDEMTGNPYNEPFKITAACTVKAIALKDGVASSVKSFDAYINWVNSVASIIELNDANHVLTLETPMTVVYKNGAYNYVNDGESFFLIYERDNVVTSALAAGKKVASVSGNYKLQNDMIPEIVATEIGEVAEDGEEVPSIVMTIEEINGFAALSPASLMNQFVKFEGVTITAAEKANNYTLAQGENTIACFNQFSNAQYYDVVTMPTDTEGKTYNVEGFISYYGGALQLNVINATEYVAPTYAVTVEANGAEVSASVEDLTALAEGAEVVFTITAPEGKQIASVTYNGEALTANEDGTYTITVNADGTLVVNVEDVPAGAYETYPANAKSTHAERYTDAVNFTCNGDVQTVSNLQTGLRQAIYHDATAQVITLKPGAEVEVQAGFHGAWMHGYLWIDYNKDYQFTADLDENNVPTANSELVGFTFYSPTDANQGNDSNGNSQPNSWNASNPFTITLPADLPAGDYRARYIVDWCAIDPCPSPDRAKNTLEGNGGIMADFTIRVEAAAPATYTLTVVDNGCEYLLANSDTSDLYEGSVIEGLAEGTNMTLGFQGAPEGKRLVAIRLNDTDLEGDMIYNFTITEDATLEMVVEDIPTPTYTVTVEANGATVDAGEVDLTAVEEGTEVALTITAPEGKQIASVTYGDETITANEEGKYVITVTSDATLTVNVEDIPVVAAGKSILVPGVNGTTYSSFRFDDAPLGAHTNGTNDDADVRTRNFTYSAWINAKSTGNLMGNVQDVMTGSLGAFNVSYTNGKLMLNGRDATTKSSMGNANITNNDEGTSLDEWVFVTVVANQNDQTVKLYKNGKEIAHYATTYGIGMLTDDCKFFIGDGGSAVAFTEVQLWNKALTEDEIKDSYNLQFTEVPENLVAYFKAGEMVEGSTTEMRNLGNGYSDVVGRLVAGRKSYDSSIWADRFYQTAQDIETQDEERVLATVNVTVNQPEAEGCSYKVVDMGGNEIGESVVLYSKLNVEPELAEGLKVTGVVVSVGGESTVYTLEQLPIRAEGDMEISLEVEADVPTYAVTIAETEATVSANVEDLSAVAEGTEVIFTITAPEGKQVASVTYNEEALTANEDGTYTITVNGDGTLVVTVEDVPEPDYETYPDVTLTNAAQRYTSAITLTSNGEEQTISPLQTSGRDKVYKDATDKVATFAPGATVEVKADYHGEWMHGYLWIDYNKDYQFIADLDENELPTAASELVGFTTYNGAEDAGGAWHDSNGNTFTDGSHHAGNAFTITLPEDLPEGEYRARFIVDWNAIEPCPSPDRSNNKIEANGGIVADFTIRVEQPATKYHLSITNPGADDGLNYYGEFRNMENNMRFDYDDAEGVDVEEGTKVVLIIKLPVNNADNQLMDVTEDGVSVMDELLDMSTEKAIWIGSVYKDYNYVILQSYNGIYGIAADGDNAISFNNGVLTVVGENAKIEVVDINGRVIRAVEGNELNVEYLIKGTYIAKATANGKVYTMKFIKL